MSLICPVAVAVAARKAKAARAAKAVPAPKVYSRPAPVKGARFTSWYATVAASGAPIIATAGA